MLPFENLVLQCIKNRRLITEPRFELKSIFDYYNMNVYLKLCTERIAKANLIDNKEVLPDLFSEYNLLMTHKGLSNTKDILKSYIDEKDIDEAIDGLKQIKTQIDLVNSNASKFMLLSKAELKTMRQNTFNDPNVPDEDKSSICRIITEELEARKLSNVIKRKFVKSLMKIALYSKYRKILNSVTWTQHID